MAAAVTWLFAAVQSEGACGVANPISGQRLGGQRAEQRGVRQSVEADGRTGPAGGVGGRTGIKRGDGGGGGGNGGGVGGEANQSLADGGRQLEARNVDNASGGGRLLTQRRGYGLAEARHHNDGDGDDDSRHRDADRRAHRVVVDVRPMHDAAASGDDERHVPDDADDAGVRAAVHPVAPSQTHAGQVPDGRPHHPPQVDQPTGRAVKRNLNVKFFSKKNVKLNSDCEFKNQM